MKFTKVVLAVVLTMVLSCQLYYSSAQDGPPESSSGRLVIAWPNDGSKIGASSTFIVGAADPSRNLLINGAAVKKNAQGFFAQVVPLKYGNNTFNLSYAGSSEAEKAILVIRPAPVPPLAASTFTIKQETIEPRVEMGVSCGDLVILKARATPGGEMNVKLGNRTIVLSPAPEVRKSRQKPKAKPRQAKKSKAGKKGKTPAAAHAKTSSTDGGTATVSPGVNEGLATTYGKVFQSLPAGADDLYVGFYKIQADDHFNSQTLKFTLKKDGKSMTAEAPGTVTVLSQPHMVQTRHDDTIIRTSPDKARLTPLPQGVRLTVDGWQGDNLRCLYGPHNHVYVKSEDTVYEKGSPEVSGPAAKSFVSAINIMRTAYGDAVVIPLNQRLPFHIEQALNPNRLVVRIYGATADTDFVSQQYKPDFEEGAVADEQAQSPRSITRNPAESGMVDGVTWRQVSDDIYEVVIKLRGHRQWGFVGSYTGTHLMVHVKNPPRINKNSNRALEGLTICVDPGHGGAQRGSIGCNGLPEAHLNLAISMKLKKILEAEGARVVMTRTSDVDIDLAQRCDIARNAGVDILLSVHNNSLPDGRDPWKEHGSSTYWYHPQAVELSRALKDGLVADLGFPDIGSRYQNLALTRPTSQLSVLAEVGFMIHPDEFAQLLRPEVQDRAAQALVGGLKKYLGRSESK